MVTKPVVLKRSRLSRDLSDISFVERDVMKAKSARLLVPLLTSCSLLAGACAALTPATDGRASDNTSTTEQAADGEQPDEGQTTTTVDFADPLWQSLKIELVPIAQLEEPTAFSARSGTINYYVAERAGRVRLIERTVSPKGKERIKAPASTPILDITEMVSTSGEGGLLGLTFSTDGRQMYVNYTDLSGDTVVDEYMFSRNGRADLDSRRELLRIPQPANNHNGGAVKIGEDGFLYIATGDGGGSGDPEQAGQDLSTLLGKVLRIDPFPDGDSPYSIPDGNPFVDGGGEPEIWLYGVRNPWRITFDRQSGDLWIADVGQNAFEEITMLSSASGGGRGANLGWSQMEAATPFNGGSAPDNHVEPSHFYPHEEGRCSITGGYVYRGEIIALLNGVYLFGDYCSGEVWGLELQPEGVLLRRLPLAVGKEQLVSFGEGPDGELFVLTSSDGEEGLGTVYRLEPTEVEADES